MKQNQNQVRAEHGQSSQVEQVIGEKLDPAIASMTVEERRCLALIWWWRAYWLDAHNENALVHVLTHFELANHMSPPPSHPMHFN